MLLLSSFICASFDVSYFIFISLFSLKELEDQFAKEKEESQKIFDQQRRVTFWSLINFIY